MTEKNLATFSCYLIGTDTLLQECGDVLRNQNHAILGVITATERLRRWAGQCGLRVLDPASDYASVLGETPFDYLFSITHLEKIPDRVLRLPRRGAINFHDGPLPRYAGLNAPAWAIMNQETSFGVCWHRMTGTLDRGNVLKRENFVLDPEETAVSLNTKCLAAGLSSFTRLVADLARDRAVDEEVQGNARRSYFGKYRRPAAAAVIDWNRPGREIEALVRGLQFGAYPNALGSPKFQLDDVAYIVTDAGLAHGGRMGAAAGEILDVTEHSLRVSTGDGLALDVREISDLRGRSVSLGQLALRPRAKLTLLPETAAARLGELDKVLGRSEPFWRDRLASLEPAAAPLSRQPLEGDSAPELIRRRLQLPRALSAKFSPGVAEVALLAILVARIGRQNVFDLAMNDADWSRRIGAFESLIAEDGCCRIRVSPEGSFDALARDIGVELEAARARGTWLHDLCAREPALKSAFAAHGTPRLPVGIAVGGRPGSWKPSARRALTLVCGFEGSVPYLVGDASAYDGAALETLAQLLESLAGSVSVMGEERALTDLPMLDGEGMQRVVYGWNRTETPYPSSDCVHTQIEERARRIPRATALVFEDAELGYGELNDRANRLAVRLMDLGVGPDRLVGIHVSRSIEMVVATLATLKAGGAYVPLDPDLPAERIRYMVEDAQPVVILTQKALAADFAGSGAKVVFVDDAPAADGSAPRTVNPAAVVTAGNLAYVIYTSGSTGRPKGVMVEHRNVVSFFSAMDACIAHDPPGVWLAVTNLAFDISVLELLWTLARGFKVVLAGSPAGYPAADPEPADRPMGFSLFMWGNDDAPGREKYRLMLEGAKYFDRNGFEAVWTPERHFHAFGGPYPNPSVTGAALAAATERIGIRAGSCVSPLHHPIRIAEEWAVVDNLSNGRVAIAFASGWQPNDFVLRPENHARNKAVMLEQIDQVRRLWRGEKISVRNPLGQEVSISTLPRPVQPELPFWVTTAGNPDTYRQAGVLGANVLTHLLGQTVDEVAEKIRAYREARAAAGHDPDAGRVTLMLHTFVGENDADVRELVRGPMKDYLRSSLRLVLDFAWSFPAFKRPGDAAARPEDVDLRGLSESEIDALLDFAFERYFETSGLFGTPSTCSRMVERCKRAGVDEIACLLDFGVPTERVLESLPYLNQVRAQANPIARAARGGRRPSEQFSIAAEIERHGVTHLQCTPSLARILLQDRATRAALARIRHLLVGGEELPTALAYELRAAIGGELRNMYGPTETTIWSATHGVEASVESVPIGRPIANTRIYILDGFGQPVPERVPGELVIGGAGVSRGYLRQPVLTGERFVADPYSSDRGARMYRTGDLARYLEGGSVEFLGRIDNQVKIRGYRVELEEIERVLAEHPAVEQAAVAMQNPPGGEPRLVAYLVGTGAAGTVDRADVRQYLSRLLPDYMVPDEFVMLARLPLTPSGKVDRKALPAPDVRNIAAVAYVAPCSPTEQALAALWQELLHVDRVGANDNFFALGGHSLLALQVVSRVRQALSVELPLRELFAAPTLSRLALTVDALSWLEKNADRRAGASRDREEIEL